MDGLQAVSLMNKGKICINLSNDLKYTTINDKLAGV